MHLSDRHPKSTPLGWVTRILLLLVAAASAEIGHLVTAETGDLPVILTAPHGGSQPIPEIAPRKGVGIKRFQPKSDQWTDALTARLAAALEQKLGKRPYVVIANFHRKYLDANRTPALSYESGHPNAAATYKAYHDAVAAARDDIVRRWGRGVLFDIHGQAAEPDAIYRGTRNGKTVTHLIHRFGPGAQIGEFSPFSQFAEQGIRVIPAAGSSDRETRYTGGHTVVTYGSGSGGTVDAIQLELGRQLRRPGAGTAAKLANAIANFAGRFLPGSERTGNLSPAWQQTSSGLKTSIRGLSAVDANTCWLGTKAGVARTTDAGKTWTFTKIGDDTLDFRDLHAIDAQRCIAMSAGTGQASRLYRTSDGGKTWTLTHQNQLSTAFFNGIAFRDDNHGVLAGDAIDGRLFLLATDDGGETWHRLAEKTAPKMLEGEHAFAASGTHLTVDPAGHIWVTSGGAVARVFHSPDWGKTWQTIDTPVGDGAPSTGIFSIVFHGQSGTAVGGDYEKEDEGKDNAMRSSDGGRTWHLITKQDGTAPFPFRSCIGQIDKNTLLATGPSGTDISHDAGATWKPFPDPAGYHTLSIAGRVAWAAGTDGRVARIKIP